MAPVSFHFLYGVADNSVMTTESVYMVFDVGFPDQSVFPVE